MHLATQLNTNTRNKLLKCTLAYTNTDIPGNVVGLHFLQQTLRGAPHLASHIPFAHWKGTQQNTKKLNTNMLEAQLNT